MPIKKIVFPTTRQEKALSKEYFSKKEKLADPKSSPAPTPKLSEEEIQHYIDLMLEASKPTEYVDRTKQILLERFHKQD